MWLTRRAVQAVEEAHSKQVTGLAWTDHAASLVTCSLDRTLRTFAAAV